MLQMFNRLLGAPGDHIPAIVSKKYFPALDGLRGVAILFVLVGHSLGNVGVKHEVGLTGVEIFFVLSGFLITTLLLKEKAQNGRVSLKNFYIRRVLRIVPVAYLFLAVLAILNRIFDVHVPLISFVASLFYIRNLTQYFGDTTWHCAHFWSLGIEEQFYLIFPFILVKSIRRYVILAIMLYMAVPILQYLHYHDVWHNYHLVHLVIAIPAIVLGNGILSILAGSLLALFVFKGVIKHSEQGHGYFLSTMILIIAVVFRVWCPALIVNTYINQIAFAVLISCVIFWCLPGTDLLSRLLSNPVVVKLGVLSYSIYIWQQLFIYQQPWAYSFKYGGEWWFNMPLLLAISCSSYYLYERKFLKLKDKFKSA